MLNLYFYNMLFLEKINDIHTKYKHTQNYRAYSNYIAYKMDAIKLAIYNNSDKKT